MSRVSSMALAFLFAGQGAQKVGMGRSLCEQSPAARALYDEANSVLGWDLQRVSFEGPEPDLTQTKVCQPALYVHGLAVLAGLREAGKVPSAEPKAAEAATAATTDAEPAVVRFDAAESGSNTRHQEVAAGQVARRA